MDGRDAASQNVYFEVLALQGGRWMIETSSPDEEVAVAEAHRMLRGPDVRGVRVSRETWNPRTELTTSWTVFEEVKPEQGPQRKTSPARAAQPPPRPRTSPPPAKPTPQRHAPAAKPPAPPRTGGGYLFAALSVFAAVASAAVVAVLAIA